MYKQRPKLQHASAASATESIPDEGDTPEECLEAKFFKQRPLEDNNELQSQFWHAADHKEKWFDERFRVLSACAA